MVTTIPVHCSDWEEKSRLWTIFLPPAHFLNLGTGDCQGENGHPCLQDYQNITKPGQPEQSKLPPGYLCSWWRETVQFSSTASHQQLILPSMALNNVDAPLSVLKMFFNLFSTTNNIIDVQCVREEIISKSTFSSGHCPNKLNPPPPHTLYRSRVFGLIEDRKRKKKNFNDVCTS